MLSDEEHILDAVAGGLRANLEIAEGLADNTPRIVASSPTCCAGYNYAHTWPSPLERNSGRMEIQSLLGAGGMG